MSDKDLSVTKVDTNYFCKLLFNLVGIETRPTDMSEAQKYIQSVRIPNADELYLELTRICFCVSSDVLLCRPHVTTEDHARIKHNSSRAYIIKHL